MGDDLWQAFLKGVKPLEKEEALPFVYPPFKRPAQKDLSFPVSPSSVLEVQSLKKSLKHYEGRLDLHGMTQREALAALGRFIRAHYRMDHKILLVITGKGQGGSGVLRTALPHWLNEKDIRPFVAAFHTAPIAMGGEGAVLIRLKGRPR